MSHRISLKNLQVWLSDQLTHPGTLLQRKSWGVFSVYSHIRRSDRLPKKSSETKDKALRAAEFMSNKYGGQYSIYKCLYCNGWHVAKDGSSKPPVPTESPATDISSTIPSELNLDRFLKLNIPDITSVYGGIRGRTMSSRHQDYAWPIIRECGIRTIIDLREDGLYTRMSYLCNQYGIDYFFYPIDTEAANISQMVKDFPEFCKRIDKGNFYIACAMGLHRTDIALCCYWVFHAADKGLPPPEIRGFRKATGHRIDKIMGVLNAFYKYTTESTGTAPFPSDIFNSRKKVIFERAKA